MTIEHFEAGVDVHTNFKPENGERRQNGSYEGELSALRTQALLREALAREGALLREREQLLLQQDQSREEADHRLLNGLQMIVSLLSLQSRACTDAEAATQLIVAAKRVASIERVHRRLHYLDGVQTVAFKEYLEDLCGDFSTMASSSPGGRPEHDIVVEAIALQLPTATGIPLGFIVNELITNATKYGGGQIAVGLKSRSAGNYALSVSNDGSPLPEGFNPAAGKGLGMKIMRSFVERIGGEFQFCRGDNGQGARFTVLFSGLPASAAWWPPRH